ncbi:hypothetical protein AR158_c534L [Paramecium bursaria Chlorella virus AR158]|uniref:hypothetical protein n=1 Tax=Paramecium bursaria Chlorella virus AR158 TaxID=380598 RepID=UPI00015AA753|nr:hypothetical protein AR158_c534L [Paramecium bursaria Chlorella virus AR158]ABU44079.1 hypothetical protein AR158_c534L [Paramecium bursaria Chlorella virus AR158]
MFIENIVFVLFDEFRIIQSVVSCYTQQNVFDSGADDNPGEVFECFHAVYDVRQRLRKPSFHVLSI